MTKKEKMANTVYRVSMVGIIAIIAFGGFMAFYGYNENIYPLDRVRGHLDGMIGTSDIDVLQSHIAKIQLDLEYVMDDMPEKINADGEIEKNPVWLFGTESTNFIRIQNDVNTLSEDVKIISTVPKNDEAYHTGMLDINSRALSIKTNIMDATPYLYASQENILFSSIWIAAILGIFTALKRKKEQLKESDEIGI